MASRMDTLVASAGARPWVIPYLTAGYPDAAETVDLLCALEEGGSDAIELGLPFSDPLADGPIIQATSQRALEGGITHRTILDLAAEFRKRSGLPLILMGYLNPILAYGADRFFAAAVAAGVDGLILPDVPPEEAGPYHASAVAAGLSWICLAAPTSSDARLATIDQLSTHFNYCVSMTGVTGARTELPPSLEAYLARAQSVMKKPFVVGFGISDREQARRVSPPASGVVVGSALLRTLDQATSAAARREAARRFVQTLKG